jgi:ABC-2 type transport system ATP-binding protein
MANNRQTSRAAILPEFAVETRALSKTYAAKGKDGNRALKAVDLQVPRGSIFGLLGPNGAGKSTLINILAGTVIKTAGQARIWGYDIDQDTRLARGAIGIVPQEINIDAFFTPREVLEFQAGLYGLRKSERRSDEILAILKLQDKADDYSRSLSGGMRRRLLVAKALAHNPPVLVLDEPTAGVDVDLRRQLWNYVVELNQRGVTVILTTHYLEEAEALCDQIAIINHGRIIACEKTEILLQRIDHKEMAIITSEDIADLPASLVRLGARLIGPRRIQISYQRSATPVDELLAAVREAGITIADLSTEESDLEDVFLELTQADAA